VSRYGEEGEGASFDRKDRGLLFCLLYYVPTAERNQETADRETAVCSLLPDA
jgi:hypothetical protein